MLSETVQQAINKQITMEFGASHAYIAMAGYFENLNLSGFANWFRVQSEEEREHALRFFDYVLDRGGQVQIGALHEPQAEFAAPLEAFEYALGHERKVTAAIHAIYKLAADESDYATQSMLKWFIDEQIEEEKNAEEMIQHLKMVGESSVGLLMLDQKLAARKGDAD